MKFIVLVIGKDPEANLKIHHEETEGAIHGDAKVLYHHTKKWVGSARMDEIDWDVTFREGDMRGWISWFILHEDGTWIDDQFVRKESERLLDSPGFDAFWDRHFGPLLEDDVVTAMYVGKDN